MEYFTSKIFQFPAYCNCSIWSSFLNSSRGLSLEQRGVYRSSEFRSGCLQFQETGSGWWPHLNREVRADCLAWIRESLGRGSGFISVYKYPKEGRKQDWLFPLLPNNKWRGNGHKLKLKISPEHKQTNFYCEGNLTPK